MKQSMIFRVGIYAFALVLFAGVQGPAVFAHEGEDHATEAEATTHVAEIAKLEQMVALLNQVLLLIKALHVEQGSVSNHQTAVHTDVHDAHEAETEMETHHDEHSTSTVSSESVARLVIEIEPHNSKTHAHVRYVDKPEEMFFVASSIEDEDGIVEDIHERTGLDTDDIREALTYME